MNAALTSKLKMWDGIRVGYLMDLYKANFSDPSFFEHLVMLCVKEQDLQKTTTWLIKHHYDSGRALPNFLTRKLLTACRNVENWEAKLHLLQLLPHVELTGNSLISAEDFVRNCLNDNNKFVRAWAYNGLYELTKYVPALKTELEFICERAMKTESAAIKSKVRKILANIHK